LSVGAFLYDNEEENPAAIGDIPVRCLGSEEALCTKYPVYLGVRGVYHEGVSARLRELGFTEIIPVTVELDMELRNAYLEKYFAEAGREFCKISVGKEGVYKTKELGGAVGRKCPTACVYVAKSIYDKQLQQECLLADYEKVIQVGAQLTEERLKDYTYLDNAGENISA